MATTPGHKLQRERVEGQTGYRWRCECGEDFGSMSVHKARGAHRQHKDALASEPESAASA